MITAIKNENASLYRDLFEEASCLLSGYERTQTFDADIKEYYHRDSKTKQFIAHTIDALEDFANALVEYGILYIPTEKGPVKNFVPELGITTLEEYYNWLPDLKRGADNKPTKYTMLPLDESHFEINANTRAILIPNEFKKNGVAVQGDDLAEVVYFKIDRYFDAMDLNNTTIYIEWETPKDKDHPAAKGISDIYIKDIESEPGKLIFGWALSDAITHVAGSLKFSVRFLQWEEQKISYSFSTLVAQVTIHPSLGLDLEEGNFIPDNVNDRLLERIEASEVVGGAKAAIPYYLQNLEILDSYDIEDNHTDGTFKLYAVATSDDTGAISYVWKRSDLDENNVSDGAWLTVDDSSNTEMVLVDVEALDYKLEEGHRYHISNGDGTYKLYDLSYDLQEAYEYNIDNIPEIYEEKAYFVVEKYGQYKVEARNRIFNSLTKKDSNTAIFKRPDHIQIDNTNQTVENHIIDTETAILAPVIIKAIGDMAYQWYKSNGEDYEAIDITEPSYEATEPGFYKLHAIRTRNRATTEGESIEYRVTNAPAVPVFDEDTFIAGDTVYLDDLKSGERVLTIGLDPNIESDEYFVTWKIYHKDKDDIEITTQRLKGVYTTSFNPTDPIYAEVFEKAGENVEAVYYATVVNKLNGVTSAPTEIPNVDYMFYVLD